MRLVRTTAPSAQAKSSELRSCQGSLRHEDEPDEPLSEDLWRFEVLYECGFIMLSRHFPFARLAALQRLLFACNRRLLAGCSSPHPGPSARLWQAAGRRKQRARTTLCRRSTSGVI